MSSNEKSHGSAFPLRYLTLIEVLFTGMVGIVFFLSGVAKWNYSGALTVDILNWLTTVGIPKHALVFWILQFFAHLLIALEIGIGLLIFYPKARRLLASVALFLLGFFSFYLLTLSQETWNCGCFGAWLVLTPKASLIKNIVLMILCGFIWRFSMTRKASFSFVKRAGIGVLGIAVLIPWRPMHPVDLLPLTPCFQKFVSYQPLRDHRYFLFLTTECDHCLQFLSKVVEKPEVCERIFFFFLETSPDIEKTLREVYLDHRPYCMVDRSIFFNYVIGSNPPTLYEVKYGQIEKVWDHRMLEKWP